MSKTARVTGEVVVKKGVEQRTETVSDTVRSTKVDVADVGFGKRETAMDTIKVGHC